MRPTALLLVSVLFVAARQAGGPPPSSGAPCTTATDTCTEWITLGGGPSRSLVYRSLPLTVRNQNLRRALVMVHGANRNADHFPRAQ